MLVQQSLPPERGISLLVRRTEGGRLSTLFSEGEEILLVCVAVTAPQFLPRVSPAPIKSQPGKQKAGLSILIASSLHPYPPPQLNPPHVNKMLYFFFFFLPPPPPPPVPIPAVEAACNLERKPSIFLASGLRFLQNQSES